MKFAHANVLTYAAIVLASCGGGGSARDPDPGPAPVITELVVDLLDYVSGSLPYVQKFSEGYVVPSASELSQFDSLLASLEDRQQEAVPNMAGNLNIELLRLKKKIIVI